MDSDNPLTGGCACGAIRFEVSGRPLRTGLCHCMTCRKAHGAAFNPFVVFPRAAVKMTGPVSRWRSSPDFERCFCSECGSRVASSYPNGDEIELTIGSFDQPGLFAPDYESWVTHREPWLAPLPIPQNERDRT